MFDAWLRDRALVVKLVRDPARAPDEVAQIEAEHRANWPRMAIGPDRIPEPVAFRPERGLVVLGRAPGRPLSRLLPRLSPHARAEAAARAADWLATWTAERRRSGPFAPEFWIAGRAARRDRLSGAEDRALLGRLLVVLKMQAARLHGQSVTQVRPHGDFWPPNVLFDGDVVTGIDLQAPGWQPLARDPARLLVALGVSEESEGPWRYGLPAQAVASVLGRPLLKSEPDGLLRFFVGIELARALEQEAPHPRPLAAVRAAIERYCRNVA